MWRNCEVFHGLIPPQNMNATSSYSVMEALHSGLRLSSFEVHKLVTHSIEGGIDLALVEYASRIHWKRSLIREKDTSSPWVHRLTNQHASPLTALEEEIYQLRTRMEQMFIREQCLTSPLVVEISMLLDEKINRYMLHTK